jgi:hypothetical protein
MTEPSGWKVTLIWEFNKGVIDIPSPKGTFGTPDGIP